jgi:hypothetical protein
MSNILEYKDRLTQNLQVSKPDSQMGSVPGQQPAPGQEQEHGQGIQKDQLILFYHEESKPCQKLRTLLPKDNTIQMVDISRVHGLPSSITSIPALLINNKEVLHGKKVFDYFTKIDEMEYVQFGHKNNSNFGFSNIDDSDSVESNSLFSSIDGPSMSDGVPKWSDEDDANKIDIDEIQKNREISFENNDK